jgi:hypothetical protein
MSQQPINHFWQNSMFEEGWFTYPNLYSHMVGIFPSNSHFVEVGSWKGRSAAFMAVEIHNSGKSIRFDCVDPWNDLDPHPLIQNDPWVQSGKLYDKFLFNIDKVKHIITAKRGESISIANEYNDKSLDFVFIDGDHRYECVKADIEAWLPKVKPGGILAGHDYGWNDVTRAVQEVLGTKVKSDPWGEGCWITNID